MDTYIRDIRHAIRGFLRSPGFPVTVVLTLALGIGANTAIFSFVDQLLLRPLPFPNADDLVVIHENGRAPRMDVSPANWLDWKRESAAFESFAAWTDRLSATLTGAGEPEQLKMELVSYEFFPILGVKPLLGRVFSPDDDRPGASPTVVLGYSLWQRKFGGDEKIVGKRIQLNAQATEVIGVMPAGFHFLRNDTELWSRFGLDRSVPWRQVGGRFLSYVVARVKPSVPVSAAQSDLVAIAARLAQTYPFNKGTSVNVIPLREAKTGEVRMSLLVLFAAVGVLLLIACSNVANLLLARSARRRQEIAVRTSLGAGRGAIIRQLLTESVILSIVAGIAGVIIARVGVGVLMALSPASLLQIAEAPVDRWVLLYAFGLSVLTGVLVGLAPALPVMRVELADYLRDGGRSVTTSTRLRQVFIVAQVAMTIVLLCGAGLLSRTLFALSGDKAGMDTANVLSLHVELPDARYNTEQQLTFYQTVIDRLSRVPGVQSVSGARDIPMSNARLIGTGFYIAGAPELPPDKTPSTFVRIVMPGYFKTLGVPILKGRDFTIDDLKPGAVPVFMVNAAFAAKYFPNQDPLTASITFRTRGQLDPYGKIIGVSADVKEGSLRGAPAPTAFYNFRQFTPPGMTLLLRGSHAESFVHPAADIIHALDPNLPLTEVQTLEGFLSESVARERLNAFVSTAFAACALLLAALGLYGLLAFAVAERTKEIGIRMALGAQSAALVRMIARQGLQLVIAGAVLGSIGSFALARLAESILYGVTAHDPLTFVAAPILLVIVAFVAVVIPARGATRIDPLAALRKD